MGSGTRRFALCALPGFRQAIMNYAASKVTPQPLVLFRIDTNSELNTTSNAA